jgi:hypothetical protein
LFLACLKIIETYPETVLCDEPFLQGKKIRSWRYYITTIIKLFEEEEYCIEDCFDIDTSDRIY